MTGTRLCPPGLGGWGTNHKGQRHRRGEEWAPALGRQPLSTRPMLGIQAASQPSPCMGTLTHTPAHTHLAHSCSHTSMHAHVTLMLTHTAMHTLAHAYTLTCTLDLMLTHTHAHQPEPPHQCLSLNFQDICEPVIKHGHYKLNYIHL